MTSEQLPWCVWPNVPARQGFSLIHTTRITMMQKRSSSQSQNRTFQIIMTVRV